MEKENHNQLNYFLSSLDELGGLLIDADKIESVGVGVLRLTLGTVMATKGAILLYKQSTKELCFLAKKGVQSEGSFGASSVFVSKIKNKPFLLKEALPSGKLKTHLKQMGIRLILPLFHKENFLGVLCIGPKLMNEKFSKTDKKVLAIITNHLTKALFNHRLINEVQKRKKETSLKLLELEALFDISVAISSVLDISKLIEDVLLRSVGVLNASKGIVLLEKEGSPILNLSSSFNWNEDVPLLSKNLSVFKKASEKEKGFFYAPPRKETLQKKLKENHLLICPISTKKKTVGYVVLCNKETRKGVEPFSAVDLDLLSALCNQAAVAVENARLFKDITKEKRFNESILGSIPTSVVTIDTLGEVDSVNSAGTALFKQKKEKIIGNHFMYLFEKDEAVLELIAACEIDNKTKTEINMPFLTISDHTVVNLSISPRIDPNGNKQGVVITIEDVSDISKIKNTFKRYVSKQVVDELLNNDAKLNLGGEEREVVVLFTDIRGFTAMAEKMNPETVVGTLNEYFTEMIKIVFKNNGTLDKIIGDELMVVYGVPISNQNDTQRAVKTAIDMQKRIRELNRTRKKQKKPEILIGAGINKGTVISGNIGSREMMDYTVIGDTVNIGARLCSNAKPGEILVSDSVFKKTKKEFTYKKLNPIRIKGKEKKVGLYSVVHA